VVAHDAPLTEDNLRTLQDARRRTIAALDPAILPPKSEEPPSELREFFILETSDGVGRVIDFSKEFVRDGAPTAGIPDNIAFRVSRPSPPLGSRT
jgi:hypothetical protein